MVGGSGDGIAHPNSSVLLSSSGPVEHFCTLPADFHFRIFFHVDSHVARPQPFTPPQVSVKLVFLNENGAETFRKEDSDTTPTYLNPGNALQPNFGFDFHVPSNTSGSLGVELGLVDPDTGISVGYTDTITCTIVPCV
jgi:hypothetical protein